MSSFDANYRRLGVHSEFPVNHHSIPLELFFPSHPEGLLVLDETRSEKGSLASEG